MPQRATYGVWTWVVTSSLVVAVVALRLVDLEAEVTGGPRWPFWVAAVAMYGVQTLPIHITTAGGRHSVVLSEVVLAIGLFTIQPSLYVLGVTVGAVPALLRLRPGLDKFVVNLLQTALWAAIPALFFFSVVEVVEPSPVAIGWAFTACVLSFIGSSLSVRVPIGLATGTWWVDAAEAGHLLSSAVTALGAAALALIGILLADLSVGLVALLALPIAQVLLSTMQQARSVDRRAALDFTVEAARRLREAEDVPSTLAELLPGLRGAFSVEQVLLLLDVPGHAVAATVDADGSRSSVVVGDALRRWLSLRGQDGPSTLRRDGSLVEIAEAIEAREVLMAPVPVSRGLGAIVLAGRSLGPFRGDHVELMRTWVAAAASALERQLIADDLDQATSRGAELERRATHDALTSLANRALFERDLDGAVQSGRRCSVLFIDLDGFKAVNDTWGHQAGDAVLVAAARRIEARVRASDVAARIGGDEFAVLVLDQDGQEAAAIADRILADFEAPVQGAPGVRSIRAAVGVSEAREGDTGQSLLARADEAMYAAKRAGGHRVEQASV